MSLTKPTYSIDAPDQGRLKIARLEIEAVLAKHDLAGVVVLHTPGMAEFFYNITPSYSVCCVDEQAQELRIKSKLDRDHGGDQALQLHDQAATANMAAALAGELSNAALMFARVDAIVTKATRAEHRPATFVPDPSQVRPS
ncbi:MAG: hypothetical protein K2Q07_09260 [Burkholderiaceae bacterium]|nr:hypothetical protein [Burkholderiaceae bacterium]